MMQRYSKLIAAIVGLAVLVAGRHGLDLSGDTQLLSDLLVGVLTAVGVWGVPNKEKQE